MTVLRIGLCLLGGMAAAHAAVPIRTAAIAVSATVLPRCAATACPSTPRVIAFEPADGSTGQPSFQLGHAGDLRVMTITY